MPSLNGKSYPYTAAGISQYKEALKKMGRRFGGSTSGKRMKKEPIMKLGGCTKLKLKKRR